MKRSQSGSGDHPYPAFLARRVLKILDIISKIIPYRIHHFYIISG